MFVIRFHRFVSMHFSAMFLVWCLEGPGTKALGKEGLEGMDWDIRYLFLFVTIDIIGGYRGIESD